MNKALLSFVISVLFFSSLNSQEWEQLNDTPFETHHAIGFSADGYGYSLTGTYSRHFYKYDPNTDSWEQLDDYPGPPRGFGINDFWEGKLYFGFGADAPGGNYLNDLWVYDPSTEEFEQLPDCPCAGRAHPAFVILNGKIYMGMGSNFGAPGGGNLNDWWEYDIENQIWTQRTDFPAAERHHPYQFAFGDYVYTGFGHGSGFISNEWYRYHPPTDSWEQLSDLPAEGRVAGQQFSYEGKGYVLSGQGNDHGSMEEGEFWEYDAQTDQWTELPPHPGLSLWAPAFFMIDGYVYLSTGEKDDEETGIQLPSKNVYRYNLRSLITSTPEKLSAKEVVIYPNPTRNYLNIDTEGQFEKATLINLQGSTLQVWNELANPMKINQIQPGLYLLRLEGQGQATVEKIIIE
jgi:N-acetylneuraminic acid mutarotase